MDETEKTKKALQILEEVVSLVSTGRRVEALSLIKSKLKVKKTQSYKWLEKILQKADALADKMENQTPTEQRELEFKEKYVYNRDTDQYIFLSQKKLGRNIVLEASLVKSLLAEYSNYDNDPQTLPDLSKKFDIPKKIIQEIFSILGFTHDDLPVLNEDLDKSDDDIIEELLTSKKFNLYQKFQKRDWSETQDKANKWEKFLQGQIHPIKDLLATWEPPTIKPINACQCKSKSYNEEETVLIGLSDLHFGLYSEADDLFFSKSGWEIADTVRVVREYSEQIISRLKRRSSNLPKKAVICLMGDLIHTLTGETDKGTQLQAHPIGEKQLDFAFDSLFAFVSMVGSVFEKVEIKAVNGNHSYFGDYALGKMLQIALREDKKFSFELSTSRFLSFNIGDSGFVMDHGASSHTKSRLPAQKNPRSNYAQSVFLANEKVRNCKYRYYLVGDQHHLEHQEYNNFELIMFGTPSGGDRYADASVLISRPRQSCLILTEEGLSEVLHFYFDK